MFALICVSKYLRVDIPFPVNYCSVFKNLSIHSFIYLFIPSSDLIYISVAVYQQFNTLQFEDTVYG